MIDGYLDWESNELARPTVVDATTDDFEAQDIVGCWLSERCVLDPHLEEKPGKLVLDYRAWAEESGETPPTLPQFRSALERTKGIRYVTVKGAGMSNASAFRPRQTAGRRGRTTSRVTADHRVEEGVGPNCSPVYGRACVGGNR
jgi:putative DNA primase/helicase